MDKKELIKKQLKLKNNIIYCEHDKTKPCSKCMKGIYGDVLGISGDVKDIIKILKEV